MTPSFAGSLRKAREIGYLVADGEDEQVISAWAMETMEREEISVMVLREKHDFSVGWNTLSRPSLNDALISLITQFRETSGIPFCVEFMPPYQWLLTEVDQETAKSFARLLVASAREADR